jgi:divalent metal cation (Fe/Co/Zn/Cd) transporter
MIVNVMSTSSMPSVSNETAIRRGRRLELLTLAWNSLEAILAMSAGIMARSVALMSFGLDSMIELFSGSVLLWRLRRHASLQATERAERRALFLVGISFAALAVYVTADSVYSLVNRRLPDSSILGIAVTAAAVVVMRCWPDPNGK